MHLHLWLIYLLNGHFGHLVAHCYGFYNIQAFGNSAEYGVGTIQVGMCSQGDVELAGCTVGGLAAGHGHNSGIIVQKLRMDFQRYLLI